MKGKENLDMDNPGGSQNQTSLLPQVGISEILGLVELLKSKGGREDIYKLAAELKMEFGDTLTVIRGAELLGLVNTPGGDVVVEPLGDQISASTINARKTLIQERLKKLPLFQELTLVLEATEDHQATRYQILEKLIEISPNENSEQLFTTLVNWARYAELFGYNDDSETFYIDAGT